MHLHIHTKRSSQVYCHSSHYSNRQVNNEIYIAPREEAKIGPVFLAVLCDVYCGTEAVGRSLWAKSLCVQAVQWCSWFSCLYSLWRYSRADCFCSRDREAHSQAGWSRRRDRVSYPLPTQKYLDDWCKPERSNRSKFRLKHLCCFKFQCNFVY